MTQIPTTPCVIISKVALKRDLI